MIVVRPEHALRPGDLMDRVVAHVLRQHGGVEAKRLSRDADREREVRFAISRGAGSEALVQVEAHSAEVERGTTLAASIVLFGADRKPSEFLRELALLVASLYGGLVWEPDTRETERLVLPSVEAMRDRRRGQRKSAPGVGANTPDGQHEIRDLSPGGLSFFGSRPYARGELIPVEIALPDGASLELLIRVRWQTAPLESGQVPLGGEIVAVREQDRQLLDQYLAAVDRGASR